jgi:hypothetical protein
MERLGQGGDLGDGGRDGRTWTRLAAMNASTSAGSRRTYRPSFT